MSLRIAPGDDPVAARSPRGASAIARPVGRGGHVRGNVRASRPGTATSSTPRRPTSRAAMDALARAYGREAIELGSGGSIPLVPMLTQTFPGIEVLIWGAMDERSFIHSVNESVDLSEIERITLAEALFLRALGGVSDDRLLGWSRERSAGSVRGTAGPGRPRRTRRAGAGTPAFLPRRRSRSPPSCCGSPRWSGSSSRRPATHRWTRPGARGWSTSITVPSTSWPRWSART